VTSRELLAQTSVFGALDEADLAALGAACRARRFAPGVVLFHVEDAGDTLFVIHSGQVKVVLETPAADHILCLCGPGDCLGELSLLDGNPRSATVIAIDAVEALALHRQDFRALMEQRPTIAHAMLVRLAEMVRLANGHVQDILGLDTTVRIAKKLLELAECHGEGTEEGIRITLPLTQRELGQMVGVSREKINRALEAFEQGGVLTNGRQGITIQRPELLRKRMA
jgi:CRP/FNR family transcriptional regulator, cyclic AMP receptor protein